jgi:hypothetical protein
MESRHRNVVRSVRIVSNPEAIHMSKKSLARTSASRAAVPPCVPKTRARSKSNGRELAGVVNVTGAA